MLGHDAAHRQIFRSGRWNDWVDAHHRQPARRHELRMVAAQAHPPPRESEQDRGRSRHRPAGDLVHARAGGPARRHRAARSAGSWRTRGSSSSRSCCSRACRCTRRACAGSSHREPLRRRPVEISFLTVRLAGYLTLVFLILSPGIAFAFLGVQLGLFGFYMGMAFAPNHKGMPLVPEGREARLPPPPGADEPQHRGQPHPRHRHGRAQLPDRAPPVPVDAAPAPARRVADDRRVLPRPTACPTRGPGCGSRTGSSSATSTGSDSASATRSSARCSRSARASEDSQPVATAAGCRARSASRSSFGFQRGHSSESSRA